jgi:hypothetical protein
MERGDDGAYEILLCKHPENYPHAAREDVKKFSSLITNFRKEAKKKKKENCPLKEIAA